VLNNGLGHYQKARAAAERATVNDRELGFSNWALAELIEAATRSGTSETAAGAYRRLAEITRASGTDWALGVQARSHALLSELRVASRQILPCSPRAAYTGSPTSAPRP